jgi:hypothetical protein
VDKVGGEGVEVANRFFSSVLGRAATLVASADGGGGFQNDGDFLFISTGEVRAVAEVDPKVCFYFIFILF